MTAPEPFAVFETVIEGAAPDAPRYVVPPSWTVSPEWREAQVVLCTLNDAEPIRCAVTASGDGRWVVELPEPHLRRAGLATGDRAWVALHAAPAYPSVLLAAIEAAGLGARWEALGPARRRALAEPIFAAQGAQTRETWVARALAELGGRW